MSNELLVQAKILDSRITALPQYATPGAAGLDLLMAEQDPVFLPPGEARLVTSGISIYVRDPNHAAIILPRSGLGHKLGVVLGNSVGLIDSDYQGPLLLSLLNRTKAPLRIDPMTRVAQLVFMPVTRATLMLVSEFWDTTERGVGGFGSTGTTAVQEGG